MREFTTAVKRVQEEESAEEGQTFVINEVDEDGNVVKRVECRYFEPGDGQLAFLMASVGRHTSLPTKLAGVINFFVEVLDEPSHQYIVGRLLDRDDEFGIEEVTEIMESMVEEWTGRPTQPPSGSTRSQRSGGRKSTARTPAST